MADEGDITLHDAAPRRQGAQTVTVRLLYEGEHGPVDAPCRVLQRGETVVVGRAAPDQDLKLDDARTSRQHATIHLAGNGRDVHLEDRSSNGTFVNGRRVESATLQDGDVVRCGDSFLILRYVPQGIEDVPIHGLLGDAPAMWGLRRSVRLVGPTDATVLIIGESGTGKELVARALHEESEREGPFVPVNCSAIPETLAESQLFGHVAGSFTGARKDHKGYFQSAHGGTLFLDEIGELPMPLQPKLLRALEDHSVTPVGASAPLPVDVRVVAATHRELKEEVERKTFRGDLFARIAEITVRTPPLRHRREDVLALLDLGLGEPRPALAPELVDALLVHPWPFNVRELLKVAKQLRIQGAGLARMELSLVEDRLERPSPMVALASADITAPATPPTGAPRPPERPPSPTKTDIPIPTREEFAALVRAHKGNVSALGRALGRSRRQIYRYIDMYEIDVEAHRGE